jgi:hypothetical protein
MSSGSKGAAAVEVDAAGALHPCKNVVDRLGTNPDKLSADDPRDEISGQLQNILRRAAIESLA